MIGFFGFLNETYRESPCLTGLVSRINGTFYSIKNSSTWVNTIGSVGYINCFKGCVQLRPDQTIRPDDKYTMRVVASDNGNPSLSSQGVVRVDVLNIELFVIQMTISISFAQFDEAVSL